MNRASTTALQSAGHQPTAFTDDRQAGPWWAEQTRETSLRENSLLASPCLASGRHEGSDTVHIANELVGYNSVYHHERPSEGVTLNASNATAMASKLITPIRMS